MFFINPLDATSESTLMGLTKRFLSLICDLSITNGRKKITRYINTTPLDRYVRFILEEIPRRHGKTHLKVAKMVEILLGRCWEKQIGAFYCVVKDQAVKVAWRIFEIILRPIPGVKINQSKEEIYIPRPSATDPEDYITIYFFGIKGGSGTKRGSYYDYVIFDEVEFIDLEFIQTVGFSAVIDRAGHITLLGTPFKQGRLGLLEIPCEEEVGGTRLPSRPEIPQKKGR